jgi:signal transduction histidine kinase
LAGRVLVVDDNGVTRHELAEVLGAQGYEVSLAVDGRQALDMLERPEFDVVLLDIIMPEIDGFAVLEQMKGSGMLQQVPVIVISGLEEMDSIVKCVQMGAEDYLSKPFNHVFLKARVGATVEKKLLRDQERAYVAQLHLEQERLRQHTLELKASNEELDAFAHTVAHDLKTPLGVVIGCSELLARRLGASLASEEQDYLGAIVHSSKKMNDITDALLMLASVRQMAPADLTPLNMAAIVVEANNRLSQLSEEQRATVELPATWPTAVGYGPWVEEVWVNYMTNAITYGGKPPLVRVGADAEQADGMVRFWVRDDGQGLTADEQKRLFTPFTRLSRASARGHGLGLSIARRIVEKLGGQVGVDSVLGEGSTFSFTLPSP